MKRRILTILFAIFLGIAAFGQNYGNQVQRYVPDPNQISTVNITINPIQNGWARVNNSCAGCPSYWVQVLRSSQMIYAEDGRAYYYYYFKYYSNSFYSNGQPAGTYLSGLNFYSNGQYVFNLQYLLAPQGQHVLGAWMRLGFITTNVSFTTTNVTVY